MSEVLVGSGLIATWLGSIWIGRLAALRNQNVLALLNAFVPPIAIIYGLKYLNTCWQPLLLTITGVVILLLCLF
jgi:hypothetical protein